MGRHYIKGKRMDKQRSVFSFKYPSPPLLYYISALHLFLLILLLLLSLSPPLTVVCCL